MVTDLVPKSSTKFSCEKCDYNTSRKSQWQRHLLTHKHKQVTIGDVTVPDHTCQFCNKNYNSRNGLWRHKQICKFYEKSSKSSKKVPDDKPSDLSQLTNLVLDVVQQNKDLTMQICELAREKVSNNNINANNINNNTNNINNNINNNFNIQVFLNETCKDAMNITEFVDSIQPQLSDLEETGRIGFVKGVSKIVIDKLKSLEVTSRPMHCSDSKRDTLYVKLDDNKWTKDNETKDALTLAIKKIASKNISNIEQWQKANPSFNNPNSKTSDKYMKLLCEIMPGSTKEECDDNYRKIAKNIIKEIFIDKYGSAGNFR